MSYKLEKQDIKDGFIGVMSSIYLFSVLPQMKGHNTYPLFGVEDITKHFTREEFETLGRSELGPLLLTPKEYHEKALALIAGYYFCLEWYDKKDPASISNATSCNSEPSSSTRTLQLILEYLHPTRLEHS